MKYYINEHLLSRNTAGSKARDDVIRIIRNEGFSAIWDKKEKLFFGRLSRYRRALYEVSELSSNGREVKKLKGEIFFSQYPSYSGRFFRSAEYEAIRQNRSVVLVHDLNSLRNAGDPFAELSVLNSSSVIITHNRAMSEYLVERGVKTPIIELGLFDYLVPYRPPVNFNVKERHGLVYAGNLEKSCFISSRKISEFNNEFYLFGPNYPRWLSSKNIHYHGSVLPEKIPFKISELSAKFGLIWDGTSIETCSGDYGKYLRVNTPHKTSLYLVSGLPIIAWTEAAIAPFIQEYRIGFTVSSLEEIDEKISSVSDDEYELMLKNVYKLGYKLRSGYFLKNALNKAMRLIK